MKKFWLLCLGLLCNVVFAREAPDRRVADDRSKSQFASLQFYKNGHGMHLSPGLISLFNLLTDSEGRIISGPMRRLFETRWGLVLNEHRISGLFEVKDDNLRVGVVGCVVCHSGKAAGQFVVGLGNKNIDVVSLAGDVNRLEKYWQDFVPDFSKSKKYRAIEKDALAFSSYLGDASIGNLTQGLVPVSFIRGWFYRVQDEELPHGMTRGQVKVPSLWGYGEKRKVGQFCDGYGDGEKPGWAVAVELAAGQKSSTVRGYLVNVEQVEALFDHFLPPPYPFKINRARAERGQHIFNQTCARCHGHYARDSQGLPVYEVPQFIPLSVVGTDSDRLDGNTSEFNAQVRRSPLNDVIQINSLGRGYFAQRLVGIWARFPYLHNGSVPNLRALLSPPSERPHRFSLRSAGERPRFSEEDLGLTLTADDQSLGEREIYDTSRVGHSNHGHDFYTNLPETQKTDIIEYLKTL